MTDSPVQEWPFGHDPTDPPWRYVRLESAEPIEVDDKDSVAARARYHHLAFPLPNLTLTVAEKVTDADWAAARNRIVEMLNQIRLYYHMFEPPAGEPPSGIEFPEYDPDIERDVQPPFSRVLELTEGESLTTFTLELEAPPPGDADPPIAVGVTIDPPINYNKVHGYVAKCTRSAWASVRATAGTVRLTMTKNGNYLASVQDGFGGGSSATIGASTSTSATFDATVKGLKAYNYYYMSVGWIRGTGGGC